MDMRHWLEGALLAQASDLHLSAGRAPMARVHGRLVALAEQALGAEAVAALLQTVLNPAQWAEFGRRQDLDFAFEMPGLGRFRVNAFVHRLGPAAVFRHVPERVPSLAELGAPALLAELALRPRGLVLVTGPTGSGKSTTLAAMVDHLNRQRACHLITIEDPIEFVHIPQQALISQREVGVHTADFASALRAALREDPDVLLVGELRDPPTIRLALTAAETGHLVLATLHTHSAPKSVDRIVDVFEAAEKDLVRTMLADSLLAVVCQTLCRRADGQGRVAAHELMLGTPAVRNLVREGKLAQLTSVLQTGAAQGMMTLDQSLGRLLQQGLIDREGWRLHAHDLSAGPTR